MVLRNIGVRPIIYVTTESSSSKIVSSLRQKGLGETLPHPITFVDAFNETVGLPSMDRQDTVNASSEDLTSLDIAIAKQRQRMDENSLLIVDSLTTPYLMNGLEILRFMRMTLLRVAGEGNAVLACFDEGCGKEENLTAMMSVADGIVKLKREEEKWFFNIVKHPTLKMTSFESPIEAERIRFKTTFSYDPSVMKLFFQSFFGKGIIRRETGNFVNLFWPNLAHWSGMLWDPKKFPTMTYELNKEESSEMEEVLPYLPWKMRLLFKFIPKSFSKVEDMKKWIENWPTPKVERVGIAEYLEDASKTDEHYFRIYENSDCWGLENVGTVVASHLPPLLAGNLQGLESLKGLDREWNAVETKCLGLGDPYCEFKVVPGEIDELESSLQKDIGVIEKIHEQMINHLLESLLNQTPMMQRPRLGSDVHLHTVMHLMGFPHIAGERYRMAQRMGGTKSGKEIGERLIKLGINEDESVTRILNFLDHCKVGKVSVNGTIKMRENCESKRTELFSTKHDEPCCFFTTGFLNGFFSAVKNQHVKETKCIVLGDPYCEWEFR